MHVNYWVSETLLPGAVSWIGDAIVSLSVTLSVELVSTVGGVTVSDFSLSSVDGLG